MNNGYLIGGNPSGYARNILTAEMIPITEIREIKNRV